MRIVLPLLLVACGTLSADGAPATTAGAGTGGGGTGTGGPADCGPLDEFDNEAVHGPGLGDDCAQGVPLVAAIPDDNSLTDLIEGNAHVANDVDWWIVEAVDLGGDEERGYEDFHLQLRMVEGADTYHFVVIKGACGDPEECAEQPGYDEFSFFQHDTTPDPVTGDYPADRRACGAPPREECTDYSDVYLVRVSTISGQASCDPYRIEVDNGVW